VCWRRYLLLFAAVDYLQSPLSSDDDDDVIDITGICSPSPCFVATGSAPCDAASANNSTVHVGGNLRDASVSRRRQLVLEA
jgi:hypothetical protein